ncbi:hypothetical protein EJB05_42541 [Eragrostis curvula]|uniref:Uncharacterized protein n=1 Tax=Eragrostis curvula TaxID=38414 RepID=A0A5J9TCF6_9POAL|nr:hypothetical protein EJB05_42541 [Eragrostis curvula]
MPGLPLHPRDAGNVEFGHPGSQDQICRQRSRARLSPAEQAAAEDNFSALYCKPLELYNIIQRRSITNPLFTQRSLLYKINARRKKRIQITVSLSGTTNTELQEPNIFPLYVLLARPTSNASLDGHSPIYRFSRVCLLTPSSEFGNNDNTEATFIIPDTNNLSTSHSCNLNIILISCGQVGHTISEDNCSGNHVEGSSLQKHGGKCSWGKIPINLLASSLENCVSLSLGHTVKLASTVTMSPSFLEGKLSRNLETVYYLLTFFLFMQPKFLEQDSCLTFCSHKVDATGSYQLQVCISAEEAGARAMFLSPYNSYLYNDVPPSSLSSIISLGRVFDRAAMEAGRSVQGSRSRRCPGLADEQGLRCHLNSSHDLFHFEFWVSEECQAVNVSLKTDVWTTECVAAGVDPRHQTFSYISKFKRRRQLKTTTEKIKGVHSDIIESGSPEDVQAVSEDDYVHGENGTSVDPAHSLHCSNLPQPTVLQFGKTRKLSAERADPRNRQLLQKRQFIHSHRSQPMALEQVFSDHDSEDEVDDDIADFEDRRMLDDFVDVTKDEKHIMHMWNSFVRKQRVLADGHIPWACEAFSQLHGKQLVQNPAFLWSWRFFIIKLWNHSLLDARTMNTCNTILQGLQDESSNPKQP